MSTTVHILQLIMNFALLWGLLLSLGTLFRRGPDKMVLRIFAVFAASQSLSLLPVTFVNYGIYFKSAPVNALVSLPPLMIGPFYYLYFTSAFDMREHRRGRLVKHLAVLPLFFLLMLFIYRNPEVLGDITGALTAGEIYARKRAFIAFQFFYILVYYLLTLNALFKKIRKVGEGEEVKSMKLGAAFTLAYFAAMAAAFIAVIVSGEVFPRVIVMSCFACMMGIISVQYLVSQRYPILMAFSGYERKPAVPLEVSDNSEFDGLEELLMALVNHEKIYRAEDLTISMVAHELGIKPWQLSQYLNSKKNMNFNSFINSFRVKEARHLLSHEPEKNILTIAFEVGFNSKSSFNRVFQKSTHLTPSEYRRLFRDIQEGY